MNSKLALDNKIKQINFSSKLKKASTSDNEASLIIEKDNSFLSFLSNLNKKNVDEMKVSKNESIDYTANDQEINSLLLLSHDLNKDEYVNVNPKFIKENLLNNFKKKEETNGNSGKLSDLNEEIEDDCFSHLIKNNVTKNIDETTKEIKQNANLKIEKNDIKQKKEQVKTKKEKVLKIPNKNNQNLNTTQNSVNVFYNPSINIQQTQNLNSQQTQPLPIYFHQQFHPHMVGPVIHQSQINLNTQHESVYYHPFQPFPQPFSQPVQLYYPPNMPIYGNFQHNPVVQYPIPVSQYQNFQPIVPHHIPSQNQQSLRNSSESVTDTSIINNYVSKFDKKDNMKKLDNSIKNSSTMKKTGGDSSTEETEYITQKELKIIKKYIEEINKKLREKSKIESSESNTIYKSFESLIPKLLNKFIEHSENKLVNQAFQVAVMSGSDSTANLVINEIISNFLEICNDKESSKIIQNLIEAENSLFIASISNQIMANFIKLAKDLNGIHIIIKYMNLNTEFNNNIIEIIDKNISEITSNQEGSCMIQKILSLESLCLKNTQKLIDSIILNVNQLYKNKYSFFVIQKVITMNNYDYIKRIFKQILKENPLYIIFTSEYTCNFLEKVSSNFFI